MTAQPELFNYRQAGNLTMIEPKSRLAHGKKQVPVNNFSGLPPPAPAPLSEKNSVDVSQSAEILAYLQSGHSITPLEALKKFGCFRLGARCWDLKRLGYMVKSEIIEVNGKHVARYSL